MNEKEYIRFCECVEDTIKIKQCEDCPHKNTSAIKFEDSCKYKSNELNFSKHVN